MATLAVEHRTERRPAVVPARWVPWTTTVLSIIAVIDSGYLTYLHIFSKLPPLCPTKPGSFINCDDVLMSKYSHPLGIPVVYPGLAWAVVMLVLCTPWAWRLASPWVARARLAGAVLGVLTVFYLLWAEFIELHHLCEYCTLMHIVTLSLFFVIVFATAMAVPTDADEAEEIA